MPVIDLEPATRRMAALVEGVPDDRLAAPTPCAEYTLGDLLDHVGRFAVAFTAAAAKSTPPGDESRGTGDAAELGDDWRTRIPRDLDALAAAWRDPAAWTGMTRAGGVDLPGEVAGMVALNELVVHGWDLAVASGQAYDCREEDLEAALGFVIQFTADFDERPKDLFGPTVDVPDSAPLLHRVLAVTGRDPGWSAR